MRIVFDHQIFGWQEYGGISRYAYQLALEMATTFAQDVSIVSPLYVNKYLGEAPTRLNVVGIPIKYIPRAGRILRSFNSALAWPILRYLSPEIVHETYYSSRRIAPKSAKVILTVYDMIHERYRASFSKYDPTSREKVLAVGRADHIICISEQTKRDLIELFGVDPAKASVVHLGFALSSPYKITYRNDALVRPFLLYVGKRDGYKNFEGLLQAYAASPMLKDEFDLICFGGGRLTEEEKGLLQRLGLSVKNVCQVSGDDSVLAGYYKSASAFIYPSFYEGFGLPPLEAMSFNCPVVCSNVSSIPEVVGDAAEVFDPHDPDSIRIAIERVVSNNELHDVLISRGQERIKHFSWKRCAQETLGIYQRVLS
jgi:glycosyltransferase involved in cell wall biosynthesis